MLRGLIAKLAVGSLAIYAAGSFVGLGLANYVESGSFHFYRSAPVSVVEPLADARGLEDSQLAFAEGRSQLAPLLLER